MRETDKFSRNIRRRIGTMLLSLIVSVSMMPVFAFAEEEPAPDAEPQTETVLVEEEPTSDAEPQPEMVLVEEEPAPDQDELSQNETAPTESEEPVADQESEPELQLVQPDADLPDPDELLEQYLEKQASNEAAVAGAEDGGELSLIKKKAKLSSRASRLSGGDKVLYDGLIAEVKKIAAGEASVCKVKVAMTEDEYQNCNFSTVVDCLLTDFPYEFYWYDKTVGVVGGYKKESDNSSTGYFTAYFSVAKAYRSSKTPTIIRYRDGNGNIEQFYLYETDTGKTGKAAAAAANAGTIIEQYDSLSDVDKLYAYMEEICYLTSYNNTVTLSSDYGDPWQLIYVFDGDPETEVVCEGYAKAFQFLCDLSAFQSSDVESHIVTGRIQTGPHMWNIISMDDGGNYIADITNCDHSSSPSDRYFLQGYSGIGSVHTGYTYGKKNYTYINYIYDEDTLALYSERELTLSNTPYTGTTPAAQKCEAVLPKCESIGLVECWIRLGVYYSSNDCAEENVLQQKEVIVPALGHDWPWKTVTKATCTDEGYQEHVCSRCGKTGGKITAALGHSFSAWKTTKAATCTAKGTQTRVCSRCGKKETRSLKALGHNMKITNTLDTVIHKCTRGDYSYTKSKVVVDLPKVTIKKPSRGKASFTAKWKKVSKKKRKKIAGIEIQYCTKKDFTSAKSWLAKVGKTRTKAKFKKLGRKKTYYVRVRSYKMINGKKHVSKWSAIKKVKTK